MRQATGVVLELEPAELRLAAYLVRTAAAALERLYGSVPADVARLADQLAGSAAGTSNGQVSGRRGTAEPPACGDMASSGSTRQGISEAAECLGVSPEYVRRLCRNGTLTAVKVAAAWQIDPGSLAELAHQRKDDDDRAAIAE
jgi:excisionase family DNA binding protein